MNTPLSLEDWDVKLVPVPDGSGRSEMVLVGFVRGRGNSRDLVPIETAPVSTELVETADGAIYRLGRARHLSPALRLIRALARRFFRRKSRPHPAERE